MSFSPPIQDGNERRRRRTDDDSFEGMNEALHVGRLGTGRIPVLLAKKKKKKLNNKAYFPESPVG